MNLYGIIILSTLLIEYAANLAADFLNLRTLNAKLPVEFEGVFDEASYKKSQSYTRTRTTFGVFESTFSLIVTLIFWFAGGFNYLDNVVLALEVSTLITGVIYIGILVILRAVLSLPFSVYSTFVIEEKYGFNKTTPLTFITDLIKGFFLIVLIGGPLLIAILTLFEHAGPLAWFYCWMIASAFVLFIQFIAPTWIMPLFNKFTPLEQGELRDSILSYAKSVNYSLKDVYMMDGSKRSSKSNAFFTGFGKNKRIALFDTLIQKHTVQELIAILAHEIGHFKKRHIVINIIISILHMGVMFFIMSLFITEKGLFDAFYMKNVSLYAGMLFFGLLFTPIEFLISIATNALSRKNEYAADQFSVETIDRSETMVEALKNLSLDNLSHLTPHPFYVFLNYSHPPVVQRIRVIRALGK